MAQTLRKILIVAGEASGDLHGSKVAGALRSLDPGLKILAMGGEGLRRAGAEILVDSSRLAVVGITEVLGRLGSLVQAYRALKKRILEREIALLLLIDFPDFNLRLAGQARKAGIPVLYYISPQVWAWRSGRIRKIARVVSRMAVIFPFEVPLYREAGLAAEFVGHPLMDAIAPGGPPEPLAPAGDGPPGRPLIALLPGSREREVKSLLPEMIRAAKIIAEKKPEAKFLLALAPTVSPGDVGGSLPSGGIAVRVVEGKTYEAVAAADLVLVASGTATLETAVLGKPMVIVYQVSPLSYWVGKAVIRVPWIGLVNIVAGKTVVPELIQDQARGERIAEEALRILESDSLRLEIIGELARVREKLGAPGAGERVARMALEMIGKANSR